MKAVLSATLILVLAAGIAIGIMYWRRTSQTSEPPLSPAAGTQANVSSEDNPQYPVSGDENPKTSSQPNAPATPPAPSALYHETVEEALTGLFGKEAINNFFNLDDIIRKFVVTVDNLAGQNQPNWELSPLKPLDSDFVVSSAGGGGGSAGTGAGVVISQDNFKRYAPYVDMVAHVNARSLVAVYVHFYPKFQASYRELGTRKYFNDRLVEVIDDLLKTPDVNGPIAVEQPTPKSKYKFTDVDLENLSTGQKILLRMGRENAAVIKNKLREIRGLLVHLGKGK